MPELAPVTFLRGIPPFDALPADRFAEAAHALRVAFFPAGTTLGRAGGAPFKALHVVRAGVVRILRGRSTVEILEPGESFGYTSLLTGEASFDVLAEEDVLAYLLPADTFQALLADGAFAAHFTSGLSRRLRHTLERSAAPAFQADLSREVGALLRRPPVWVREDASVGEAARAMRDGQVSSVLVRCDPTGIVTVRDFRNRVLAERRGAALPVMAVVTRPLRTLDASAPLHAAWAAFLDAGVHHLPVVRAGEIAGVITSTDLLRATVGGPIAVVRQVERLASRAELPGQAGRLAEMADALLAGGLDGPATGVFAARVGEALVQRVAEWALEDLGPAPARWALVMLGAEGRMEQPLATERDHGLVVEGGEGADLSWFTSFAERVDRDLEAAGFPAGRGRAARAVATVAGWADTIARAAGRPGAEGPLLDLRKAAGPLDLQPLEAALAALRADPGFRRALRKDALAVAPPVKLGQAPIDLDAAGLDPLVKLARAEAVAAGSAARSTIDRLTAAERADRLSAERHAEVAEAFRFLLALRLRLQLRRLAEGRAPSAEVEPGALEPSDRARLKDAFRVVRGWQDEVGARGEGGSR